MKKEIEIPKPAIPVEFTEWWNPKRTDPVSGASIGGHPDARRVWARRDGGHWMRRTYGCTARTAWEAEPYREEFNEWVRNGRPERPKPFVSISATLERQKEFWQGLKAKLAQIGKPMPKQHLTDYDPEVRRQIAEEDDSIPF